MTAKEYLTQVYYLDQEIDMKLAEIECLNRTAEKVPAPCASRAAQYMETMQRITKQQYAIYREIIDLLKLKRESIRLIGKVASIESQMLLTKRYLSGKSWTQVAEEMGYTLNHVYKVRRRAIKEFGKECSQ